MKIKIELTQNQAALINTFIRRSIFEQFERNMFKCGDTREQTVNRAYETIEAFSIIRDAITETTNKRGKKNEN